MVFAVRQLVEKAWAQGEAIYLVCRPQESRFCTQRSHVENLDEARCPRSDSEADLLLPPGHECKDPHGWEVVGTN